MLFTNYAWHVEAFREAFPDAVGPAAPGRQMPAWHAGRPGRDGVTLVDIGVGPSNAKTITDHVAVLRPDLMLMIGHCGGLRNHQDIGDLVLATTYHRADGVLDHVLPTSVPVASNHRLNSYLLDALVRRDLPYRLGTVYTTDNRNWEFEQESVLADMRLSRAVAVDMESATVAANGFRYRVPTATLLAVSDKPLHGRPKLSEAAQEFYARHEALAPRGRDRGGRPGPGDPPGRAAGRRRPLGRRAAARPRLGRDSRSRWMRVAWRAATGGPVRSRKTGCAGRLRWPGDEVAASGVLRVADALAAAGATGEVVELAAEVRTAALAAAALGVEVGEIANSLVFDADGEPLLVLTCGAHRVDTAKVAALLGVAGAAPGHPGVRPARTPAR